MKVVKPPQTDNADIKECSVEITLHLEEMSYILKDKRGLIQAFALIMDLYKSNQLVNNKFIVAE